MGNELSMKHLSEEDLVLIYYGEPEIPEGARVHLAGCEQCKAAADSLAQTLDLCNEWRLPTPDAGFERRIWPSKTRGWFAPRPWVTVAAAAALLVAAFVAGRQSKVPQPESNSLMAGLSNQARERILEISLADHLDRAGILLTEISNAGDSGARDFTEERNRAQDLIDEGRLMRQTLASQGVSPTLTFLDEMERFLIEVANAPDSVSGRELRELQERIGANSLLFKVRVIESNLRTQGQRL
jgi:hypothetical protein